ncbi:hypothetical protein ABZZ37_14460 [Streptomyces sp. NPDC006464]|uniref:hypothetical protein n=1 Tax=Streptomyces sp. NPDC006464 TaxID=3154305 RepID=UPI0033BBB307
MSRPKWTAIAAAVVVLGTAGCGTDAGATAAPPSPRPAGTGPLSKQVVRTDLDGSAADAGAPANDPWVAGRDNAAPADSPQACTIAYKGFATETQPIEAAHLDRVVRELEERDWKQFGDRKERKAPDGVVFEAHAVLAQRGWRLLAEYRHSPANDVLTLSAFDDTCLKKNGPLPDPIG